jgi:hypothetical protein
MPEREREKEGGREREGGREVGRSDASAKTVDRCFP